MDDPRGHCARLTTKFPDTMLSPGGGVIPFSVTAECYTEAVGFVEGFVFKGTYVIDYKYKFHVPPSIPFPAREFTMRTEGVFEVNFK